MKKLAKTIGVSFVGILILLVAQITASIFYSFELKGFQFFLQGVTYVGVTYILLKLFANKILRKTLSDICITKFKMKLSWIILSMLLPCSVIFLTLVLVPGNFSYNFHSFEKTFSIILYALFSIGISAGIVEEFVFRGLIMSTVSENYSKFIGVLVPSILFGALHLLNGHLNLSSFAMLLLGGSLVGILFSLLACVNQTVWASVVTHSLWNFFIIGDLINFGFSNNSNSLSNYTFTKDYLFFTGGEFGIEVSGISIICYTIIIVFLLHKQSNLKHKNAR